MKGLRTIGFAICFSAGLAAATSTAQGPSIKDSIAQQEQKLAQARASNDMRAVVTELNILGGLYRLSGQLQKALDDLNEALPIEQKASSLLGQGTTLMTMGRVYSDIGQEDKALALLNQALPMWRALGSRSGEAATLSYIGKAYNNLGNHDESLRNLNASMAIWHQIDTSQRPRQTAAGSQLPVSQRRQRLLSAPRPTSRAKPERSTIWDAPTPTWARASRRSRITTRLSLFSARQASATARR